MIESFRYSIGEASSEQIRKHLQLSDEKFYPPLSERIDIAEYSLKISKKAINFEAWNDIQLVGLIAVYNNSDEGSLFITNVSVLPDYGGKGIASHLLKKCFNWAATKQIAHIKLEVNAGNQPAISFYTKLGFKKVSQNESIWQMHYNFQELKSIK